MATVMTSLGEVAEPAGAAPFAALDGLPAGEGPVVLPLSGGSASPAELRAALGCRGS